MHAPYAAQYCVIGGSGAGSGGICVPLPTAALCAPPAIAADDAPLSALVAVADAAVAMVADAPVAVFAVVVALPGAPAVLPLAGFAAAAVAGADALASGAVMSAGMLVPNGAAEKLLGGRGGREGTPVEDVLVATGCRGGNCDSWTILTLVCLFAIA